METGTGLFLGLCAVATVYLFTQTKNTWNWRRITLVSVSLGLGIPVSTIVFMLTYDYLQSRPRVVTELRGVTLGDNIANVQFKVADLILKDENRYDKGALSVYTDGNKVTLIGNSCDSRLEQPNADVSVNGIGCGAKSEQIIERFGRSVRAMCKSIVRDDYDRIIRRYEVPAYGTRYLLMQNSVIAIAIMEPQAFERADTEWVACG